MPASPRDLYIVRVIPISRSAPLGELTYFSTTFIEPGTLVSVPLRGKSTEGLVTSATNAQSEKASLKREAFALKKIKVIRETPLFLPSFLRAVNRLTERYASSPGSVLRSLVPLTVLKDVTRDEKVVVEKVRGVATPELTAYQASYGDRVAMYYRMIRTAFARGQSVFVIAPTIEEMERLHEVLQKGIEHRAFAFSNLLPKKELLSRWKKVLAATDPVVIVSTPSFLSIPRSDIGLFILERESARSYTLPTRPYLHIEDVVEALARETGAQALFADEVLSVTTWAKLKDAVLEPLEDMPTRLTQGKKILTINTKRKTDEPKKAFTPFSTELQQALTEVYEAGSHSFLFSSRRGLAGAVVCNDCGDRVSCAACGNAVSLETKNRVRTFTCRRCNESRSAKEACSTCGSWNLIELGIGVERVFDEAKKLFKKESVFLLDPTTAPDHKKAVAIRDHWKKTPGGILVGTERALPYLPQMSLSGVVSLDSLLALPEWRAHERAFSLLRTLAALSDTLLIQTRRPKEEVLRYAEEGAVMEHMEKELRMRKQFNYPPYATLVLLSLSGSPVRIEKELTTLEKQFTEWKPSTNKILGPRGSVRASLLLKIPGSQIPEELKDRLQMLPPYISTYINPESLST